MTKESLAYKETFDCVQCGYCLPACPTYISMGSESQSPRGRINLVKMAAEGKITYTELEGPMELCLGCRACEVVCPTNVQYGKILDSALAVINEHKKKNLPRRATLFKEFVFGKAITNKTMLKIGSTGLSFYQKTGLQKVAQKTKVLNILPENLRTFEKALPKVEGLIARRVRQQHDPPKTEPRFHIGFFTGCVMDAMFSRINTLSIKLLQAVGCEVTVIKDQTCCGALQHHSGEVEITKQLAKQNIKAFEKYDFDYIVNSIGGCGAMLVEYDRLFATDDTWRERAKRFAQKNVDISVILNQFTLPFKRDSKRVGTYQPSCHLSNVQKRVNEPLQLIQSIPGLQFIELPDQQMCCGSAGIYNVIHFKESMEILDNKMTNVNQIAAGLDTIITTNPGCHLQMKVGVEREGLTDQIEVMHLVELLAEACDITE